MAVEELRDAAEYRIAAGLDNAKEDSVFLDAGFVAVNRRALGPKVALISAGLFLVRRCMRRPVARHHLDFVLRSADAFPADVTSLGDCLLRRQLLRRTKAVGVNFLRNFDVSCTASESLAPANLR